MKRELIFILLELFTIRNIHRYSKSLIYTSRNFIFDILKSSISYSDFRLMIYKRAVYLHPKEFSFIMSFMSYIKKYIDVSY